MTMVSAHKKETINLVVEPVCDNGTWTRYFNRDFHSGFGEYETLVDLRNEMPGEICENPNLADARVRFVHTHYSQTGQEVLISPSYGFSCINRKQIDGRACLDYEVRFCCSGKYD